LVEELAITLVEDAEVGDALRILDRSVCRLREHAPDAPRPTSLNLRMISYPLSRAPLSALKREHLCFEFSRYGLLSLRVRFRESTMSTVA
jgi:hypothetical protein